MKKKSLKSCGIIALTSTLAIMYAINPILAKESKVNEKEDSSTLYYGTLEDGEICYKQCLDENGNNKIDSFEMNNSTDAPVEVIEKIKNGEVELCNN